jgi:hypothetical protein
MDLTHFSCDTAAVLLSLARRVQSGELSQAEALQRAHQHGIAQGRIEGLEMAQGIMKANRT